MGRIVVCGESLVDFVPTTDQEGRSCYLPRGGGSPFNICVAVAQAGGKGFFAGSFSNDLFGDFLISEAHAAGIQCTYRCRVASRTPLAFVSTVDGQPEYAFANIQEINSVGSPVSSETWVKCDDIIVAGSAAIAFDHAGEAIESLANNRPYGSILAIDPNVREQLIPNLQTWRCRIDRLLDKSDIIKMSIEDLEFMAPSEAPAQFADRYLSANALFVIISHGEGGAELFSHSCRIKTSTMPVNVADTVGAGDTLMGAMLAWLQSNGYQNRADISKLQPPDLMSMMRFAGVAASLCCSRQGCVPPTSKEIQEALEIARDGISCKTNGGRGTYG